MDARYLSAHKLHWCGYRYVHVNEFDKLTSDDLLDPRQVLLSGILGMILLGSLEVG